MALQYRIYQNNRKGGNRLFYGRAVHPQTIGLSELADRVQRQCSMTKGDCLAVITELITVMKDEMQNSNRCRLDGLGCFYLSIRSSGAIAEEKYNATENIKGVKVNFLAQGYKTNGMTTRTFCDGVKFAKATGSEKANTTA